MKILVISDTHGDNRRVYDIFDRLPKIDLVIHCGDYKKDADELAKHIGQIRIESVKGNCDSHLSTDFSIVETEAGDIFVTHGHDFGVNYSLDGLAEVALDYGCKAVCFGHTHMPLCIEHKGILMVNPGSLNEPRGASCASCAVITTEKDAFYANIAFYSTLCKSAKEIKKGGYLRDMLNYSDGF